MKKLISLILALCLLATVLPMAVMADEPAVPKIKCCRPNKKNFTITPSATASYIVSKEDKTFEQWTGAEAPTDNYVKFELIAGTPNVVKATFKNFNVDNVEAGGYTYYTIEFQAADYDVEMVWEGENSMYHGRSSSIKCKNNGKVTITGSGSMYMDQNEQAAAALWIWGGDLLIKNTTLSIKVAPEAGTNSNHQGILSSQGNVTIEGCKITSDTIGGSLVWMGTLDNDSKKTITDDVNRIITVKDSELDIKVHNGTAFASAAPAKISNTTMKVTKTTSTGKAIFVPAPTFEGEYTAIGGLAKNADNLSKLKVYDETKLSGYTYIYVVPGIQDLLPTEAPELEEAPDETPNEIPDATIPEATAPEVTQPAATQPAATQPAATQPAGTQPTETTPQATEPADTDNENNTDGNSNAGILVLSIVLAVVVLAGGGILVFFILKKKGIIK